MIIQVDFSSLSLPLFASSYYCQSMTFCIVVCSCLVSSLSLCRFLSAARADRKGKHVDDDDHCYRCVITSLRENKIHKNENLSLARLFASKPAPANNKPKTSRLGCVRRKGREWEEKRYHDNNNNIEKKISKRAKAAANNANEIANANATSGSAASVDR